MFRFLLCLLLLSGTAWAEGTVSAAGRIERATGDGSCSAVLVRHDVVATAAHCAQRPNMVFRPGDGVEGETYPLTKVYRHPLYDPNSPRVEWKFRFDIAVAKLAKPVPLARAVPLSLGDDAASNETLFLVSWRNDGTDRPRQRACRVEPGIPGLVTLLCRVKGGESGAPVLRKTANGLELVAVLNSRAQLLSQPVGQASNVRLRVPPLLDLVDADSP